MSAAGVTFKCGACGKFMAVGEELRGRQVRCPHCQRVVQVPAAQTAPVAAASEPQPSASPSTSAESALNPTSNGAGAEDSGVRISTGQIDSIFAGAEVQADDLFQRDPVPVLQMPDPGMTEIIPSRDQQAPPPPVLPEAGDHDATVAYVAPAPSAPAAAEAPGQPATPAAASASPTAAIPPAAPALPIPENPWAQLKASEHTIGEAPTVLPKGVSAIIRQARARMMPRTIWILAVLIPYSLVVTIAAGYLYFRKSEKPIHPLESMGDQGLYEEYQEGKKRIVDPNSPLPPNVVPVKLNEPYVPPGSELEITPVRVAREKLTYTFLRGLDDKAGEDALVLHLRLKNVSKKLLFHPNDPTFNRAFNRDAPPFTYLEVGDRRFYGAVQDVYSERIQGQSFEELLPGASMPTIVVAVSNPQEKVGLIDLLKSLRKEDKELIWRVHLRKGRETIATQKGPRQAWTTTVVPITFKPSEIEGLD